MNRPEFADRLLSRATAAEIPLPQDLVDPLHTYYELLATWSRKINLTAVNLRELPGEAVDRLFIEPLAAARFGWHGCRVIDIGSGSGSPAIPFALAVGAQSLTMIESRTRKSVFLREAARAVALHAEVVTSRYETALGRPDLLHAFDVLTIRAVRLEGTAIPDLGRFLRPGGAQFLFQRAPVEDIPEHLSRQTHQLTLNAVLDVITTDAMNVSRGTR